MPKGLSLGYGADVQSSGTFSTSAEDFSSLECGGPAIEIPGEPKSPLVHSGGARFVSSGAQDRNGDRIKFVKHGHGDADELRIHPDGHNFAAHRKP